MMESIDWQMGKSSSECTKYMLENSFHCDVSFKVGENKEIIKAHKLILSMRSAVFDRMFSGSFCEAEKDPVIPDVTPAAFKTLLRYCYYECLDIEDDVELSALYAAKKYMLPLLEEAVREQLILNMHGSNLWDLYTYAISVNDTVLLTACRTYCQGKKPDSNIYNYYRGCGGYGSTPHSDITVASVREVLQAEAFLTIPHKVLLDVLHINDNVGNIPGLGEITANDDTHRYFSNTSGISISESELFKACNAWGEAECLRQEIDPTGANKRTVLGECLSLIRFPTMLLKDLANVVYPTGILTQTEIVNLYQMKHGDPGYEYLLDFLSEERQFLIPLPGRTYMGDKEKKEGGRVTSTMCIETKVRVMLSSLWTYWGGSYNVAVTDNTSKRSWSMVIDTKKDNLFRVDISHSSNGYSYEQEKVWVHCLEIEPQILEPGTRYTVTATKTADVDCMPSQTEPQLKLEGTYVYYNEISITTATDTGTKDCVFAVTMSLV